MVCVFLADGFEEAEALIPVDYLRRSGIEVKTVGVSGKMVQGAHGITVVSDWTLYDVILDKLSLIVLPGGRDGTLNLEKSSVVKKIITYCIDRKIPVGAICAAPSILGHMGCCRGKKMTCYPGFEKELDGAEYTGAAVEVDENLITACGAGVANQFAFALIEKCVSKEKADQIRAEVRWKE